MINKNDEEELKIEYQENDEKETFEVCNEQNDDLEVESQLQIDENEGEEIDMKNELSDYKKNLSRSINNAPVISEPSVKNSETKSYIFSNEELKFVEIRLLEGKISII